MSARIFESSFEVEGSPVTHWEALVALRAEHPCDEQQWYLPGFDATGRQLEVEAAHRLSVRKDQPPCEGTTIAVPFEASDTGTRITVVQSGFDAAFLDHAGDAFWMAAEQIGADFELFFRCGVQGHRHSRPWVWPGFAVRAEPIGLELSSIHADTYATRMGLETGDVLLTLAGAPIVTERDLATVLRVVAPGADVGRRRSGSRAQALAFLASSAREI